MCCNIMCFFNMVMCKLVVRQNHMHCIGYKAFPNVSLELEMKTYTPISTTEHRSQILSKNQVDIGCIALTNHESFLIHGIR